MKRHTLFIDENLEQSLIWWLVSLEPYLLQDWVFHIQQTHGFVDSTTGKQEEIKYSKISPSNVSYYQAIIDEILKYDRSFHYMQFDRIKNLSYGDFVGKFTKTYDLWTIVLLDYISNQWWIVVEKDLYRNNHVQYALRLDSKSSIMLQISDLLLWLATRDYAKVQSSAKQKLIQYFRSRVWQHIEYLHNDRLTKNASYSITDGWFTSNNKYSVLKNN
jgi:hypothetical protein